MERCFSGVLRVAIDAEDLDETMRGKDPMLWGFAVLAICRLGIMWPLPQITVKTGLESI